MSVAADQLGVDHPSASSRRSFGWLWVLLPLLFLLTFFVYPLSQIAAQSLSDKQGEYLGLSNWSQVLGSAASWNALLTTLQVAALATLGCLLVGTFLAFVLCFVPFPGSRVVSRLIELVVCFPSFLIPLAFGVLYGGTGVINALLAEISGSQTPVLNFVNELPGVVLAEVAFYTPFVVRPLLAAFSQIPREQLDVAASLGRGPLVIFGRVILPAALPTLLAAGGLTFLLTMNEFGIVLFTGAKSVVTLPMLIYTKSIVTFDFPSAAVLACVQVVISLGIYALYRWVFRRLGNNRGED
ncbi:2-aminoethylphosphonate ABC transporter permease subunit [Psychromicrobium lacuslunae]|uniref:2-aminoethylphosphonate transport system permease PhnU n=1 Tax=Psychromicrobium lacuslunae TaxID=1618207 RepID=A0A0D4BZ67_9MICC|nr:2-aminoethylphosphonate ABC transporter permease subunit [Psychromicrobium lacuslunae]AJT41732.1 2-aminoethylphosphonate transport system permease PhnU [Psychromicrobium lacuslunae]